MGWISYKTHGMFITGNNKGHLRIMIQVNSFNACEQLSFNGKRRAGGAERYRVDS